MKSLLMLAALCPAWAQAAAPAGFAADEIAIWAAPVEDNSVFEQYRAEVPVNPASTMKLLTGWAALNRLGPGYRWKTEFRTTAPVQEGVLQGDVYWVGRGDPRLDSGRLLEMLRQLRQAGVRDITGRLLLDTSVWQGRGSADGFDGDANRVFTVPPHPHQLNFKVAWLRYRWQRDGVQVVLDPPLPGIRLQNRLTAGGDGRCGDVRQHVTVQQAGDALTLSGQLPAACDGTASFVNLYDSERFAGESFTALWQQLGGSGPHGVSVATAPPDSRLLWQGESDPLQDVLRDMNKFSNNTMARTLLLTLGSTRGGSDTLQDGIAEVKRLLAERQLPVAPLVLENGAGLSRRERVSARLLGEVLREAARGPYGPELMASLPLAGEDGTLRKRLAGFGGNLRLKTGSLDEVRALAGYWQAPTGQRLVLVLIVNAAQAERLTPALDEAVRQLIARYQARLAASGRNDI